MTSAGRARWRDNAAAAAAVVGLLGVGTLVVLDDDGGALAAALLVLLLLVALFDLTADDSRRHRDFEPPDRPPLVGPQPAKQLVGGLMGRRPDVPQQRRQEQP